MMPFRNYSLTKGGNLTIGSMQSPDYAPGSTGWQVRKNGTVEFNSGTFRGTVTAGEFAGTDFVINSDGAFFYSGTPALGNLFLAIASTAGTDQFGNTYPGGYSINGGLQALMTLAAGGLTMTTPYQVPLTGTMTSQLGVATVGMSNKIVMVLGASASSTSTEAGIAFDPLTGNVILSVGTVIVPQDPGGSSWAPEQWHVIGTSPAFGAGFTAPGAGDQTARFRFEADGTVSLDGVAVTTGATAANAAMFTLPSSAYFPLKRKRLAGVTSASGYTVPGATLVQVSTAGVVTCVPACSGAGQVVVLDGMRYPVD
jgi:hypothetical protein